MNRSYLLNRQLPMGLFAALEGQRFVDYGGGCLNEAEDFCLPYAGSDTLYLALPQRCQTELSSLISDHFTSIGTWVNGTGNGGSDDWTQSGTTVAANKDSKILNKAVAMPIGNLYVVTVTMGTLQAGCVLKIVGFKTNDANSSDYDILGTIDGSTTTFTFRSTATYSRIGFYLDGDCELDSTVDQFVLETLSGDTCGGAEVHGCGNDSTVDASAAVNTDQWTVLVDNMGSVQGAVQCDCLYLEYLYWQGKNLLPEEIAGGGTMSTIDSDGDYLKTTTGLSVNQLEVSSLPFVWFSSYPHDLKLTVNDLSDPIFFELDSAYGIKNLKPNTEYVFRMHVRGDAAGTAAYTTQITVTGLSTSSAFVPTQSPIAIATNVAYNGTAWFELATTFMTDNRTDCEYFFQVKSFNALNTPIMDALLNGDSLHFDDIQLFEYAPIYSTNLCLIGCDNNSLYLEGWNDEDAFNLPFSLGYKLTQRVRGAITEPTQDEDERIDYVDSIGQRTLLYSEFGYKYKLNIQLTAPEQIELLSYMINCEYFYIDHARYTAVSAIEVNRLPKTNKQQASVDIVPFVDRNFKNNC